MIGYSIYELVVNKRGRMKPSPLTWSKVYETGIKAIDNDHKVLFEEIRELSIALLKAESEAHIDQAITCLENYISEHFHREETFMLNAGYPKTEEHIRSHRHLSRQVQCLRHLNESEDLEIDPAKLAGFLSDWLSNHILNVDMAYIPYLQGEATDRDENISDKLHEVSLHVPTNKRDVVEGFIRVLMSEHPLANELSVLVESFEKRLAEHEILEAQKIFCTAQN